ncbi:DUF488 family protein [Propioniciclava coleopterorum]|uniref:DUF488 family protein n=1 Tax=Propioniciclava coleopterorum TaxID=2714937 RepID=A0A6G7YA69_9ACTN|nr:DUF488 family protein [Propioniciclava coleopterorum]QIK73507.1 DUF488 family protein [Propioniciclava coleopterorum]
MTEQLRLKRVYEEASSDDGFRVLVDRLWPRGESRAKADLDLWDKDVAPSTELRDWFGHDPARFAEFTARYRAELSGSDALDHLVGLLEPHALVTLLFGARDTVHNQAVVLADVLAERLGVPAPTAVS